MKNMLSYLVALSFVFGVASNTAAIAGDKCDKPCAKGEKKECKKSEKCTKKSKDGSKETIEKVEEKKTETKSE